MESKVFSVCLLTFQGATLIYRTLFKKWWEHVSEIPRVNETKAPEGVPIKRNTPRQQVLGLDVLISLDTVHVWKKKKESKIM